MILALGTYEYQAGDDAPEKLIVRNIVDAELGLEMLTELRARARANGRSFQIARVD